MKQKIKYLYLIIGTFIILGLGIIISNKPHQITCDEPFDVIYLKASEVSQAHNLLDKVDIVAIPELNQVNARTEILNCPNFDYSKYINLG